MGINIGNSDGLHRQNGFYSYIFNKYILEFKMRGTIWPSSYLLYWENNDYLNASSRIYVKPKERLKLISKKFQKYSFLFHLGKTNEPPKKFGLTQKEWNINLKIDEKYTFSAYFPKKNNQKVYYEDGWGQRDYRDSDIGATLPYFI